MAKEHMMWAKQAQELVYAFKNLEQFANIAPFIMNRVVDRHNRFSLVSHFATSQRSLLSKISQKMGRAFSFNYWNPNGRYELNLANQVERDLAVTLIILNKDAFKRMSPGETMKADRSQMGNKSCFRNEKFNTKAFTWTPDWVLP